MPDLYLSRGQLEARLGLVRGATARYVLPEPDAVIGPINADGSVPRGSIRGWKPSTIDAWDASRPTRHARRNSVSDDTN